MLQRKIQLPECPQVTQFDEVTEEAPQAFLLDGPISFQLRCADSIDIEEVMVDGQSVPYAVGLAGRVTLTDVEGLY